MVPHTGKKTKKIQNGGFTLLETLCTVAILIILMALSAVGVAQYIDYLDVTKLDNAARDIYMAAENRAVLLQNSGASVALLSTGGGGSDPVVLTNSQLKEDSNRDLLPAGTIDPALWNRDFRVVYDQKTGHVKEVFYAKEAFTEGLGMFQKSRGERAGVGLPTADHEPPGGLVRRRRGGDHRHQAPAYPRRGGFH